MHLTFFDVSADLIKCTEAQMRPEELSWPIEDGASTASGNSSLRCPWPNNLLWLRPRRRTRCEAAAPVRSLPVPPAAGGSTRGPREVTEGLCRRRPLVRSQPCVCPILNCFAWLLGFGEVIGGDIRFCSAAPALIRTVAISPCSTRRVDRSRPAYAISRNTE